MKTAIATDAPDVRVAIWRLLTRRCIQLLERDLSADREKGF